MASRPRYVAVNKADEAYGLPRGTTQRWLDAGVLQRVLFVDKGEPASGVRTEELLRLIARARAAAIRRSRASAQPATLR